MKLFIVLFQLGLLAFSSQLWAQTQRVVDIPTRTGVTQRMLVLAPGSPKAAVVLLAGGHGGLQISLTEALNGAKATSSCVRGSCSPPTV